MVVLASSSSGLKLIVEDTPPCAQIRQLDVPSFTSGKPRKSTQQRYRAADDDSR
jgi:hypothetical protein